MVSFDIHPLLTHIHTVFLIVLVKIVKMAVNTEAGTYWQHHPQSRWPDKAEVTTPCTRVHVGEGTTSHPQEGNHPGKMSKPQGSQAPTQELCSALRQTCLCSVILPLPFFNPSIARRRRGAFTLPPSHSQFPVTANAKRTSTVKKVFRKDDVHDLKAGQRSLSQPSHTSGSAFPNPTHSRAKDSLFRHPNSF